MSETPQANCMASPDLQAVLAAALAAVEMAKGGRERCPFAIGTKHRGSVALSKPCPVCGKKSNGDGGTCTTEIANNGAIIGLENALATIATESTT